MKRLILLFIFLIFIINNSYCFELTGIGPIGIDLNFTKNNNSAGYEFNLLSFMEYDDLTTYLYLKWTPLNYRYINKNEYYSIINLMLFWNVGLLYTYKSNKYFENDLNFGPFISINYAPNFNFKDYVFTYGLIFYYIFPIIYSEIGCKNFSGKNNIYINFICDIPLTIFYKLIE
jgi:hypothetical protein